MTALPPSPDHTDEHAAPGAGNGAYRGPGPDEIDRLVHEPARLLIIANLSVVEEADFNFLMNQTGLSWGNLSSHLSKLEAAGYVAIAKSFVGKRPYTLIRLTDSGRAALESYRATMSDLLGRLSP